jgi:hypothetical protein
MEGLDVNLNREKLKTTLVPMPYPLSPLQPASWISRHSQDGGKVVKQEKLFFIDVQENDGILALLNVFSVQCYNNTGVENRF